MRLTRHWRPTRKHLLAFVGVALLVGMYWLLQRFFPPVISIGISLTFLFLLAIINGYRYNWRWTGLGEHKYTKTENEEIHHRKTLWDWLQLLIIPAVLAGAALLFNVQNAQTQQALTTDNQREAALQSYIDSMSEHLLHDKLRTSAEDDEIRSVARTRTLSTLRQLDGARKGQLIQFLSESGLITNTNTTPPPIISLRRANLTGVDLRGAVLHGAVLQSAFLQNADLRGAILQGANLQGADLRIADLSDANLSLANLQGANLGGAVLSDADLNLADLRDADLMGATVTNEELASRARLNGAILPDGTKVPDDVGNPFR